LPDDLAVVDYFLLPDELVVTWLTRSEMRVRRVPVDRRRVEQASRELVRLVSSAAPDVTEVAGEVASLLLSPIEAELRRAPQRILAIVPHRELHQVPFAMLPFGDGPLLDRWPTFLAPSLGALAGFLDRPSREQAGGGVVAIGDAKGDLAGARAEVLDLTRRFSTAAALVGGSATEDAVRGLMPTASLLHFAVHGTPARRGTPAALELLPGGNQDGRLTADEVAEMSLAARLVVLSACDTGTGDANPGDELVGVLDRAFLRAGADAVVSARWRISDEATRTFMDTFYGALAEGASRVEALNTAQRRLRDRSAGGEALASARRADSAKACEAVRGVVECAPPTNATPPSHPYFWAAFALVGNYGP
jgi:CHAT domain-containing protein